MAARKISRKDRYVWKLLKDPNYRVEADGRIMTRIGRDGRPGRAWRRAGWVSPSRGGLKRYRRLMYRGIEIYEHRVVYAARTGQLSPFKTVDHPNLDGTDNRQRLRQLTHGENISSANQVYRRMGMSAAEAKRNWINGKVPKLGTLWRGND